VILNFTINNILISSIIIKSIVELNSRVPNPSSKPRVEVSKPEPQSEPGAPSQSEDRGSTPQTPKCWLEDSETVTVACREKHYNPNTWKIDSLNNRSSVSASQDCTCVQLFFWSTHMLWSIDEFVAIVLADVKSLKNHTLNLQLHFGWSSLRWILNWITYRVILVSIILEFSNLYQNFEF
jgi:hypothetical protein